MTEIVNFQSEKVKAIVKKIVRLHRKNGGATINLKSENLLGKRLYAVAIFSKRKLRIPDNMLTEQCLPDEIVELFVKRNLDLLSDSLCAVGTWNNQKAFAHLLEISIVLADKDLAIEIGKAYNQISIYDLYRKEEIKIGGNDILPPKLESLSESERLGRIRSLIKRREKAKNETLATSGPKPYTTYVKRIRKTNKTKSKTTKKQ